MATNKRDIIDGTVTNPKDYFLRNDNLNSVQAELSFSILRRYNCFAGCKICYIDKDFEKDAKDSGRFEILVGLVEAYEAMHYPINLLSPIDQSIPKIDIS